MRIGFLGLGKMRTPMALRLLAAGHDLSVWNRTEQRPKPAIHEGAFAAGPYKAVACALPLLETFSRSITIVGKDPHQAFAMRPAANHPNEKEGTQHPH